MLGMGSNTELTRKYERVKVQNDIHMSKHIYINQQTSLIFNCVTPESVSLASLARQLVVCLSTNIEQACLVKLHETTVLLH